MPGRGPGRGRRAAGGRAAARQTELEALKKELAPIESEKRKARRPLALYLILKLKRLKKLKM